MIVILAALVILWMFGPRLMVQADRLSGVDRKQTAEVPIAGGGSPLPPAGGGSPGWGPADPSGGGLTVDPTPRQVGVIPPAVPRAGGV